MLRENFLSFVSPDKGDALEIVFLILIATLFLIGIILNIHLRIKWKKILESGNSSGKFTWKQKKARCEDIDSGFELERIFGGSSERFVAILPGMFLVLGILGTFIGLMLALGNLEGNIGASSDARNEVITAIGTQFKTSIWGIAANLFFNLLSNLFLNYQRYQGEATYLANKTQKDKSREFQSGLNSYIRRLVNDNHSRNNLLSESIDLSKQIIATNQSVSSNTLKVKNAITEFQTATKGLLSGLQTTTDNFVRTSEKFSSTVDKFDLNTKKVLDSIKIVIDKLENVMQTFSDDTKKIFTDPKTGMQVILTTLKEDLKNSLEEIKQSLENEINKMNETIEDLVDQSEQLKEAQIVVTERMEQQEKHNAYLVRSVRESQAFLKQFKDEILGEEGELYNSLNSAISQIYAPEKDSNQHLLQLINSELKGIRNTLNKPVENKSLLTKIENIGQLIRALPTEDSIQQHIVRFRNNNEQNGSRKDGKPKK